MRKHPLPLVFVAVLLLGLMPGPARAADGKVDMRSNKFEPREVQVSSGGTVTWTNQDSLQHSVAADDGSFDSHPKCGQTAGTCMKKGETFSQKISKTTPYYCRVHGAPGGQGMAGTVKVG
jgi:plastocyanin